MKITNLKKLEALIKEAEGRATARTITVDDVVDALAEAEEHLDRLSTKKDMIGTTVRVDVNAQRFPRAYNYTPESTHFEAEVTKSGWRVTKVYRAECTTKWMRLTLSETLIANMVDHVSTVRC